MLDTSKEMSAYILATAILCGIPYVHAASKGQRVLSSPDIPETQFTCVGRPPGYYADLETGCQVYHMCTEGGNQFSYRCPNTTLFQQRMLICAHWYQVNCSRSEQHYGANLLIGQRDKPFVDDLNFSSQGGKQLKTLQNPDSLQNLGHPAKEKQSKSPSGNEKIQGNGAFQNNFKRDGESSFGFAGKSTPLSTSYPTTSIPIRTTEDLSSLPLAGSVLPGGLKSFNLAYSSDRSQPFQSNTPSQKPSTERSQFGFSSFVPDQRPSQPVSFTPITTPKSTNQKNFVTSTKSPVRFSTQFNGNPNSFQPIAFNTPPTSGNVFQPATSNAEINLNFQPPNNKQDLTVASQENAFTSRFSTTPPPSLEISGESIPETDVKAVIESTKNGSLPDDKYNTFIKRFNPYEEEPSSTKVNVDAKEVEEVHHTFINRFVPSFGPSAPEDNREQQEDHVFVNRFILTPEELQREKDRTNVNQLHEMLPPDDHLSVNFPNFDLSPPADDSDDSESNKIELHLQDSRRNLFIPDEGGNDFSKADAAPIVVTIPLHSVQRSPPMWFRIDKSDDPCGRCHPAFITNKDTCLPCVIIR